MSNIYARQTKIPNVIGRIDYLENEKRQENILDFYNGEFDLSVWKKLKNQNHRAFLQKGSHGKCNEAREFVIGLPDNFVEENEKPAEAIQKMFYEKFKVPCVVAIHYKEKNDNLHCHILFSEREALAEPIIKIAKENHFYNEDFKRCRTKKEILDENGNVKKGCFILPKGLPYEQKFFGEKKQIFKTKDFIYQVKNFFAEKFEINVFDRKSPLISQVKIGRGNSRADEIKKGNELTKEYNNVLSVQLKKGTITKDKAHDLKSKILKCEPEHKNELLEVFISRLRALERDLRPISERLAEKEVLVKEQEARMPELGKTEDGRRTISEGSRKRTRDERGR